MVSHMAFSVFVPCCCAGVFHLSLCVGVVDVGCDVFVCRLVFFSIVFVLGACVKCRLGVGKVEYVLF